MTCLKEDIAKKRDAQTCPECRSKHLAERIDEKCVVCLDCGFVISAETAKLISERETKSDQRSPICQSRRSSKAASSIEDRKSNKENMVHALEQWKQVRIWDSTEKNLALAVQYVTKIAIDLSLPENVLKKAILAYKRIIEEGLLKGRSMKVVCAIVVYIGCKQCKTAITIKDIAHASRISSGKISHSYRSIVKRLDVSVQPTSVGSHATELSARLQLSARTIEVLDKIIDALNCSKGFVGKPPAGIACATIYLSSLLTGERRTQREIAEAARITEATIRARCRELERRLIFIFQL